MNAEPSREKKHPNATCVGEFAQVTACKTIGIKTKKAIGFAKWQL